jgi:ketosteroid isomerase-like protein
MTNMASIQELYRAFETEGLDRVVELCDRGRVLATGAEFDMPEVHVRTMRHGKVTAAEFYVDTCLMLDVLGKAL